MSDRSRWTRSVPHASVTLCLVLGMVLPLWGLVVTNPADERVADMVVPAIPWGTLGISLLVACAAGVLATVGGACLACVLELTDLRGGPLWLTLFMIPFACPGTVWTLSQTFAFGPGGAFEAWLGPSYSWVLATVGGKYVAATLVLAQLHLPLAAMVITRGIRRLPRAGWEAACFYLPGARRVVWLCGALLRELTAAGLLASFLSLGNFQVPHVLQCRLYSVEIYLRLSSYLDQRGAAWVSLPILAASLMAAGTVAWLIPRSIPAASGRALHVWQWGRWSWLGQGALLLVVVVGEGLPMVSLVRECRSWSDWMVTVQAAGEEAKNSVQLGATVAGVALLAALAVSVVSPTMGSVWPRASIALTLGVPSLLVGLAYSRSASWLAQQTQSTIGEFGGWLVAGLCFHAWPYSLRIVELGWEQVSPRWLEAARLSGMGWWPRVWNLFIPWLSEHAWAVVALAFTLTVGDVEITQLLCAPGEGTLALRLFTFLHFGPRHTAAGLAALQIVVSLLPLTMYCARYARVPRVL